MANNEVKAKQKKPKKGGGFVPALCNLLGTLLLVAVIALCAPLTVPQLMGYGVYDVVSGSMEPEIPVGSAVYTKPADPAKIEAGEVIAFCATGNRADWGEDREDVGDSVWMPSSDDADAQESAEASEGSGASEGSAGEGAQGSSAQVVSDESTPVIMHRVVTNRTSLGEFVTKGDANEIEDINPVPYEAFIGRVETVIPMMGTFMAIYATTLGKVYLLLTAACGLMLHLLAHRIRETRRARAITIARGNGAGAGAAAGAVPGSAAGQPGGASAGANERANAPAADGAGHASGKKKGFRALRTVLICILAVIFLGSGGVIGYVTWQYSVSDALYRDAASQFTTIGGGDATIGGEKPPIDVDFKALRKKNPDVVGWIYCEDTVINYPVMQGKDNDFYLSHDYTGAYNIDGSIFVDCDNSPGFADSNTIVYGHHMNSGAMFASLVKWEDQAFYDKHPVVWLLTPERNYKVVLFSGHHVPASSSMYDIIATPGKQLDDFLAEAERLSNFKPVKSRTEVEKLLQEAQTTARGVQYVVSGGTSANAQQANPHYVMLSTCAYLFDNDRYVLHGVLV